MGAMGSIILIFLVIGFFRSFLRKGHLNFWDWAVNLFISGIVGAFLGFIISLCVGSFLIPGKYLLIETEVLEPVVVGGKEKFLMKNGDTYLYFIKNKAGGIETRSILLENKNIKYEKGARLKSDFKEVFKNDKLSLLFFKIRGNIKITLSSEEDIF